MTSEYMQVKIQTLTASLNGLHEEIKELGDIKLSDKPGHEIRLLCHTLSEKKEEADRIAASLSRYLRLWEKGETKPTLKAGSFAR